MALEQQIEWHAQQNDGYQEIPIARLMELENQFRNGANWFYWIAALSLASTVLMLIGSTIIPALTLGTTEFLTEIAMYDPTLTYLVLVPYIIILGIVVLVGYLSNMGIRWVYMVGIVLFILDTMLLLTAMDLLGVGFHIFALFFMIKGYTALGKLKKLTSRDN
jgi:amino acid transporter